MQKNNKITVSIIIPTVDRRDDVTNCVSSVLSSDDLDYEVIVVDNGSTDDTVASLNKKFGGNKKVKIIESKINLGAGGGRNRGAKEAAGEYLLFIDNDNVIDRKMVSCLVSFMENNSDSCMAGPIMFYQKSPKIIWLYFADVNMKTSRAIYKGTGKNIDDLNLENIIEVGHLPNCFMVRKSDFWKVKGFDEKYIVMYEEADLAEKLKHKTGKKIYLIAAAKTYHNVDLPSEGGDRSFGLRTDKRAYLTARNRVYFMKKNAKLANIIIFMLLFNPLLVFYYCFNLTITGQYRRAFSYFRGNISGFFL